MSTHLLLQFSIDYHLVLSAVFEVVMRRAGIGKRGT